MEHTRNRETLAVLLRFIRRYWRIPAQLVGVLAMLLVLLMALPFLPRFNGRVEAATDKSSGVNVATVKSRVSRGVGSAFSGLVASTAVRVGQRVRKGDLLFTMDTAELQSALASARAEEVAAQSMVSAARDALVEHVGPLRRQVRALRRQLAAERSRPPAPVVAAVASEELDPEQEELGLDIAPVETVEVVEPMQSDPARIDALRGALAEASRRLAAEGRQWAPAVRDAEQQLGAATRAVGRIRSQIALATRRSPMDGVVTEVSRRAGQHVVGQETVVRLDDPDEYRVVVKVDQEGRGELSPGAVVPMDLAGTPDQGTLEKIVAGTDKDLYSYWLWLRPSHPERLHPGQRVTVDLSAGLTSSHPLPASGSESRSASRR